MGGLEGKVGEAAGLRGSVSIGFEPCATPVGDGESGGRSMTRLGGCP